MNRNKAKLKFYPNRFEVVEDGDHVVCAISGKPIPLNKLSYWSVELQEPYFSPKKLKSDTINLKITNNYFHLLCVQIHCFGFLKIIFSIS